MGRPSQRKGRRGEIELCQLLNDNGIPAQAGTPLAFGNVPDVTGVDGIHVECKRVEKLNLSQAMKQAITDSEKFHDGMPCVFHRKNREQWLVTMTLNDWVNLYMKGKGK